MTRLLERSLPLLAAIILVTVASPARAQSDPLAPLVEEAYRLLESGSLEEARSAFNALADNYPDYGPAYTGLAAVEAMYGNWNSVEGYSRDAVVRDPTIPLAQSLLCRALVANGELREGLEVCEQALSLDPTDAIAYEAGCSAAIARYQWSDAVRICGDGLQVYPDAVALSWRLGVALSNTGRNDEAAVHCDAAVASAPDDPMAHYCAGSVALSGNSFSSALEHCEAGVSADPSNALVHYCRGMAHLGLGNPEMATTDCVNATDLAPNEALGHFCLGRISRELGQFSDAEAHFERALEINEALVEARASLGDVMTRNGRAVEGEAWIRQALAEAPNADRYGQLGRNLYEQGLFEEAIEVYDEALSRAPNSAPFLANIGLCHRRLGHQDEAIEYLRRAAYADPRNPSWFRTLVETAQAFGDHNLAAVEAAAALSEHPNHPALLQLRCSALTRAARYDDAEPECIRAGAATPDASLPQQMLGVVYLETERPLEAETVIRAAIALGADDAYVWLNLGNSYMNRSQPDEAIGPYRAAINRDDTLAYAHYALGRALEANGESDFMESYCRAQRLEPMNPTYADACTE